MRTNHYVTIGMFLCAASLCIGGLDHWNDALKPQFISGACLAIGTLFKAMNEPGPSADPSKIPSVTSPKE